MILLVSICIILSGRKILYHFALHNKTDLLGSQQNYARHIYANPLQPEICPILLLGIHWLYNYLDIQVMLFPENKHYGGF